MKTTVELSDGLLTDVRDLAKRKGWTVKVVLEQSLREFLAKETAAPAKPFQLKPLIVTGGALADPGMTFTEMLELSERPWPTTE
jgi:hypothetical protein